MVRISFTWKSGLQFAQEIHKQVLGIEALAVTEVPREVWTALRVPVPVALGSLEDSVPGLLIAEAAPKLVSTGGGAESMEVGHLWELCQGLKFLGMTS